MLKAEFLLPLHLPHVLEDEHPCNISCFTCECCLGKAAHDNIVWLRMKLGVYQTMGRKCDCWQYADFISKLSPFSISLN